MGYRLMMMFMINLHIRTNPHKNKSTYDDLYVCVSLQPDYK